MKLTPEGHFVYVHPRRKPPKGTVTRTSECIDPCANADAAKKAAEIRNRRMEYR